MHELTKYIWRCWKFHDPRAVGKYKITCVNKIKFMTDVIHSFEFIKWVCNTINGRAFNAKNNAEATQMNESQTESLIKKNGNENVDLRMENTKENACCELWWGQRRNQWNKRSSVSHLKMTRTLMQAVMIDDDLIIIVCLWLTYEFIWTKIAFTWLLWHSQCDRWVPECRIIVTHFLIFHRRNFHVLLVCSLSLHLPALRSCHSCSNTDVVSLLLSLRQCVDLMNINWIYITYHQLANVFALSSFIDETNFGLFRKTKQLFAWCTAHSRFNSMTAKSMFEPELSWSMIMWTFEKWKKNKHKNSAMIQFKHNSCIIVYFKV